MDGQLGKKSDDFEGYCLFRLFNDDVLLLF